MLPPASKIIFFSSFWRCCCSHRETNPFLHTEWSPCNPAEIGVSFNTSQFDFLRCYTCKVISSTRKAVLIFPFQLEWVLAANTTACFWVLERKTSRHIGCGLSVYINKVKNAFFDPNSTEYFFNQERILNYLQIIFLYPSR